MPHTPSRGTRTQAAATAIRLHQHVAQQLKLAIKSGAIKVGDQLPTEVQLSAQYGVSRSTIRLALKDLEEKGLITRTRSRGTFLARSSPAKGKRAAPLARASNGQAIGVILRFAAETDALQTGILLGVEHAAQSRGYNVLFARSDDGDEQKEASAINKLLDMDVSGLIVMPISERAWTPGAQSIVDRQVPLVLVDRYLSRLNTAYVTSDNYAGGYRAAEHLILLGYSNLRFAVHYPIVDAPVTTSVRDRYLGYCQALDHYGLSDHIQPATHVNTSSADSVADLIAPPRTYALSAPMPTAIVAANDYTAIKIVKAAADMGRRAPEDFALVGFDDLPIAEDITPPLTTVLQARYDQGFQAGHLLLDKIQGFAVRNDKIVLPVSLVVRETCGAHALVGRARASALS